MAAGTRAAKRVTAWALTLCLASLLAEASEAELAGRAVDARQAKTIRELHVEMGRQQQMLIVREVELANLGTELERLVKRFRELKAPETAAPTPAADSTDAPAAAAPPTSLPPAVRAVPLLLLVAFGAGAWQLMPHGLQVDAATQVLPVNGSREALFAFVQTVIDPSAGDVGDVAGHQTQHHEDEHRHSEESQNHQQYAAGKIRSHPRRASVRSGVTCRARRLRDASRCRCCCAAARGPSPWDPSR